MLRAVWSWGTVMASKRNYRRDVYQLSYILPHWIRQRLDSGLEHRAVIRVKIWLQTEEERRWTWSLGGKTLHVQAEGFWKDMEDGRVADLIVSLDCYQQQLFRQIISYREEPQDTSIKTKRQRQKRKNKFLKVTHLIKQNKTKQTSKIAGTSNQE